MFHKEFYPTPVHVLEQMSIDCYDKIVFEPSAGKGDIIDFLKVNGAKEVLSCEINDDLSFICASKSQLIGRDFFSITSENVSHIHQIVMNPPFSNADKHILHAWQIAPEGCEIIALCNYETLDNSRGWGRKELVELVSNYGEKQNLNNCFSAAERATDVNIGLVRIFKPIVSENFDYDGFYFTDEDLSGGNGIMQYNEIRAIVNTYVAAVKCFDKAQEIGKELNSLVGTTAFNISFSRDQNITTKEQFIREFQLRQWKKIFAKFNIEKYVTKGVLEDVNRLFSSRQNYPFTMRNIYRMIEIVIGTRENTMHKAIVEAVDNFTRHTHENRYGVEGWKTNTGHLLNPKFIVNCISEVDYSGKLRVKYYGSRQVDYLVDLQKAICLITGTDFDTIKRTYDIKELRPNTWYDWGFFEFKTYLKGTGHFKFKDLKVWENLNRTYAKIKGQYLPEKI